MAIRRRRGRGRRADTSLSDLNKFFEWNSAAVVTERVEGEPRAVAVVTKVDLLTWMVRQGSVNGHSH
jgi:cystathionine beta-synthase